VADERIQLILDLGQSGKNAAEVRAELEKLDAAAKNVGQTYEVLAISGHGYELGAERITIEQKRATQAMEAAAKAARDLATEEHRLANEAMDEVVRAAVEATQAQRAMNQILAESTTHTSTAAVGLGKVDKASKESAQGILRASYAVQDLTAVLSNGGGFARALGSVQNNIPGIVASLGMGAGLAGTISLVSVGIGVLIDNLPKLYAAWSGGETDNEADRMERLAKAAKEAAVAIQAQITAMKEKENRDADAAEIATAAIQQAGGTQVAVNAVQEQMQAEAGAAAQREAVRKAEAIQAPLDERKRLGLGGGAAQEAELSAAVAATREARAALKAIEDEARTRAQETIVNATKGDRGAIADLARRFPGEAFDQATPEAIRAQNAEVDASEAQGERLRKGNARRKAGDAQVDDLNRAGQENEAALARDQQAADAKDLDKLLKGLDKVIDVGAKALEPDDKGDARRAGIARQAGLGRDFKDFANDNGFAPLKSDLATAAKMIDADMADGISEDAAMQSALNALIDHVVKGTAISNRRAMQARQFQAQVNNINPFMDEGNR
jgi:hypothetical protein